MDFNTSNFIANVDILHSHLKTHHTLLGLNISYQTGNSPVLFSEPVSTFEKVKRYVIAIFAKLLSLVTCGSYKWDPTYQIHFQLNKDLMELSSVLSKLPAEKKAIQTVNYLVEAVQHLDEVFKKEYSFFTRHSGYALTLNKLPIGTFVFGAQNLLHTLETCKTTISNNEMLKNLPLPQSVEKDNPALDKSNKENDKSKTGEKSVEASPINKPTTAPIAPPLLQAVTLLNSPLPSKKVDPEQEANDMLKASFGSLPISQPSPKKKQPSPILIPKTLSTGQSPTPLAPGGTPKREGSQSANAAIGDESNLASSVEDLSKSGIKVTMGENGEPQMAASISEQQQQITPSQPENVSISSQANSSSSSAPLQPSAKTGILSNLGSLFTRASTPAPTTTVAAASPLPPK